MPPDYPKYGEHSKLGVDAAEGPRVLPDPPGHGHARRARRTADRILSAAASAFAQNGYRATTIELIAEIAEVAPSSIYNHFRNKAGVAQGLAERALCVHADYIAAAWLADSSPLRRLIAVAGATLTFSRREPELFQAISLSFLGPMRMFEADTAAARAIADRRQQQLDRISSTLREAVEVGQLRPLDTSALAQFLIASWAGVLTMGMGPGAPVEPGVVLGAGIRSLIEGVGTAEALDADGVLSAHLERDLVGNGLADPRDGSGRKSVAHQRRTGPAHPGG